MRLSPARLGLLGLTVINVGAAIAVIATATAVVDEARDPSSPAGTFSTVRTERLEVLDKSGVVRAQVQMEDGTDGGIVFRLRDEKGQIRVKLGASGNGSGLVLLDDQTEVGVHLVAGADTRIAIGDAGVTRTLTAKD